MNASPTRTVFITVYATIVLHCACEDLVYSLTVRDFLPSQCSILKSDVAAHQPFSTGIINNACPYRPAISAGIVSGHPDFDRATNAMSIPGYFRKEHLINGNDGYIKRTSSKGNMTHEKTVEEFLEVATSGLPKPVYCKGNSRLGFNNTVRCGLFMTNSGARKFATVSDVLARFALESITNLTD